MDKEYWMEKAVELLFPRRCPVCGEIVKPKGNKICPDCKKTLHFVKGAVCLKCGRELVQKEAEYCLNCVKHPKSFLYGTALLTYNEVSAKSMAQIKYNNKREYLDFYSEEMVLRMERRIAGMNADALIPVPVHPSRKRARGFNQAEELADRIGKKINIPVCSDILVRRKRTLPQKELSPAERLRNLEQAFSADKEKILPGIQSVILVDDIYTTGSTIEACTRVLKKAGIKNIYFTTICIGADKG